MTKVNKISEGNFERYAQLKVLEKEVKEELRGLSPILIADMEEADDDKVRSSFGTFSITNRRTWSYSTAVEDAERRVDAIKKREKADGTANYEEATSIVFRAPKEE